MLLDCQNNESHNFTEDQSKHLQQKYKGRIVLCIRELEVDTQKKKRHKETVSFLQHQSM